MISTTHAHQLGYNETEAKILAYLSGAAYAHDPNPCSPVWIIIKTVKLLTIGVFQVHKEFHETAHVQWKQGLETHLSDPRFRSYPVTFTGHSSGGAVASLSAMKTVVMGHRESHQVKVVTFGQPRVGDINFARNYDRLVPNTYRVVHKTDLMPHMPPCDKNEYYYNGNNPSKPCSSRTNGFYHQGTEIWYKDGMGSNEKHTECLGEPRNEDFQCSDMHIYDYRVEVTQTFEHAVYFDRKLSDYGEYGCPVHMGAKWYRQNGLRRRKRRRHLTSTLRFSHDSQVRLQTQINQWRDSERNRVHRFFNPMEDFSRPMAPIGASQIRK
ncbi:unnamed protein product [Anisakis simplex]|uniref:Lipase_3 domain-containing protein n=1 Tax=Anisakis simplex TaxID=6269 RepID=A0A0M3K334_ANISI|nr:unnamed protein product [Anisakis simplex]